MAVCAIISEYNPFHLGHAYQIEQTRNIIGENSAIVCFMSGNYVQRGEFAIYEKYLRAKTAVLGGADLVFELPLATALSSAEGFAQGAVKMMKTCGVITHLSFGSEHDSLEQTQKTADFLESEIFQNAVKIEMEKGENYAIACQKVLDIYLPEHSRLLKSPNSLLGISYLRALKQNAPEIKAVAIKRQGAAHDGDPVGSYASASYLRKNIWAGSLLSCKPFMPDAVYRSLCDCKPNYLEEHEKEIMSYLRRLHLSDYQFDFGKEGIKARFFAASQKAGSLEELYSLIKTKRYTLSRIRRLVICAYLGITEAEQKMFPQYIRVLALNNRGRQVLRQMKSTCRCPVLIKPAASKQWTGEARRLLRLDELADDLYHFPEPGGNTWRGTPFYLNN